MRKINNNQSNILVGPKVPKVLTKRQDIKESLTQIQRLSYEIDIQFKKNQQKQLYHQKKNNQQKQLSYRQQQRQIKFDRQVSNNRDELQQDSQQQYYYNKTSITRAVQLSIVQYYGLQKDNNNNRINHSSNIEEYQQYKRIRQFNKDFFQIKEKLEMLRKLVQSDNMLQQKRATLIIQNESDVIKMIKLITLQKEDINNNNINYQQQNTLLQIIQKLQTIKQTIQHKQQQLLDDIQYKKRLIKQLKSNQNNIMDDIEIMQSRNNRLRKQLSENYGIKDNDKLNYDVNININSNNSSEEQQQQQHQEKGDDIIKQQQQHYYQQSYQQQYLQLMQHYNLYNPQTQTITTPFPKNKTQAMQLLNKLDTQITQLQLKQTLKLFNNSNN